MASDRFKVSVFPVYEDGDSGDLCSYFEGPLLNVTLQQAGIGAERWLEAPPDDPAETDRQPVRFSVEVELF